MLFSIIPEALVLLAIGPDVGSPALLLVFLVVSLVRPAILPSVQASAMKFILFPVASVAATIRPVVLTESIDGVPRPVSIILGPVSPRVYSLSVLHTLLKEADVAATIWKHFLAFSMLKIVQPVADVVLSIAVGVDSVSICLVLNEGSFECVSVAVVEGTLSLDFVVDPLTNVLGAIRELLGSIALSDLGALDNLSCVCGAIRKFQFLDVIQVLRAVHIDVVLDECGLVVGCSTTGGWVASLQALFVGVLLDGDTAFLDFGSADGDHLFGSGLASAAT